MLSRAEMEQTIIQGGSVLWKGRTISRVQDLPSEADLAEGNPDQEAAALAALDQQIAGLQAQRDRLAQRQPPRASVPAPSSAAEPPASSASQTTPKASESEPKKGK